MLPVNLAERRLRDLPGEFSVQLAQRGVGFLGSVGFEKALVVVDAIQAQQRRHVGEFFQQGREGFQRAVPEIINRRKKHKRVRKSEVTEKNVSVGGPARMNSGILF